MSGVGKLDEERAQHRQAEVKGGELPLKAVGAFGVAFVPENPCGEDAVEEGLDERGAEEVLAFLALEGDAEGVAEGFLDRIKRLERGDFHAGAGFAGITGEEGGEVFRRGDAGIAAQGTAEELPDALVEDGVIPFGEAVFVETNFAVGDGEAFTGHGLAVFP